MAREIKLAQNIRKLRESLGMSMGQFSRYVGLSTVAISLIERGLRDPKVTTLIRIMSRTGLKSLDELVYG